MFSFVDRLRLSLCILYLPFMLAITAVIYLWLVASHFMKLAFITLDVVMLEGSRELHRRVILFAIGKNEVLRTEFLKIWNFEAAGIEE